MIVDLCRQHATMVRKSDYVDVKSNASVPSALSVMRSAFSAAIGSTVVRLNLVRNVGLASNVGGDIVTVVADGSNLVNAQDWSVLTSVFDEFRLMGSHIQVHPWNKYSKATTISPPIVMVYSDADSTALTFYANNSPYMMGSNCDDLFARGMTTKKPNDPLPANGWNTVSAAGSLTGGYKFYSTGATASTNYGLILVTYHVEFRLQNL